MASGVVLLTRFVERIRRPNLVNSSIQVVVEAGLDCLPNFILRVAGSCKEYGKRRGLCAFDSFRVVVSDLGSPGCLVQHGLVVLECKANGTDAHSRTIAPTVVGARILRMEPAMEKAAVSSVRVTSADVADGLKIRAARQDRLCNSNREYGVIGEAT